MKIASATISTAAAMALLTSAVWAAPPRELRAELQPPTEAAAWLQTVAAPGAHDMVVDDRAGLLIVARSDSDGGELRVFQLDGAGKPRDAEPQRVALPRVEQFPDSWVQFPLSLALHPQLPLLYVWQEVRGAGSGDASTVHEHLDRLLIYEVAGSTLTPRWAGARGVDFNYGHSAGVLAVDGPNQRLYPPNMTGSFDRRYSALGWFDLDADGLPRPGRSGQPMRTAFRATDGIAGSSYPLGVIVADDRTVVFGADRRVVTWNINQPPGVFIIMNLMDSGRASTIADHPTRPMLYVCARGGSVLHRIRHAQGQLTMMPRQMIVTGAQFASAPVVLVDSDETERLLIGGPRRIYAAELDNEGRFTGEVAQVTANSPSVQTLAVSSRHGLAYVPVEDSP